MQREIPMPDRVHAPVNPMQPPRFDRPGNRPLGKAKWSFELPNRNDAMLTLSHLRQSK
jgi:hypothetical protein